MKVILFFVFVVGLALANAGAIVRPSSFIDDIEQQHGLEPRDSTSSKVSQVNFNDYLDSVMDGITTFMQENGLDPMEMPDMKEGFSVKYLFITYHGELEFTKGVLNHMSTLFRNGDALLTYDKKTLNMAIELGFTAMQFEYEYLAKIMNIGPTGGVLGKVKKVVVSFEIAFDVEDFQLHLIDFDVPKIGRIDVSFSGNALTDWLINGMLDVTTILFKNLIKDVVATQIKQVIENQIDLINNRP